MSFNLLKCSLYVLKKYIRIKGIIKNNIKLSFILNFKKKKNFLDLL